MMIEMKLTKGEKYWIMECNSLIGQGNTPMEAAEHLMELIHDQQHDE